MCDTYSEELNGYVKEMNSKISEIKKLFFDSNNTDRLLDYYNNNEAIIKSISHYINLDSFKDNDLKDKFNSVVERINTKIQVGNLRI